MSLEMYSFSSSASDLMDGYSGYMPAGYGHHHGSTGVYHHHHHHHHQDVSYQHSTGYTAEEGLTVAASSRQQQQHSTSTTFPGCRSPTQQSWAGSLGSPGSPRLLTELGPGSGGGDQHHQLTALSGYVETS